jgi:hypothetical protein
MASIFGKKGEVTSKSWSDLWDEDIEEEEEEAEKQFKARQMQNARTWSHESKNENEDDTIRGPLEPQSSSLVNIPRLQPEAGRATADIDADLVADGFFFHDTPPKEAAMQLSPRYSPPPKRTTFDKWSALGERRRAYTGTSESEKSPELWKARRSVGLGFMGFGAGSDNKPNTVIKDNGVKDKGKDFPWASHRARDNSVHQRPVDDLEWVSGWRDAHL